MQFLHFYNGRGEVLLRLVLTLGLSTS